MADRGGEGQLKNMSEQLWKLITCSSAGQVWLPAVGTPWLAFTFLLFLHSLPEPPSPFNCIVSLPLDWFTKHGFSPYGAPWWRNPHLHWAVVTLCCAVWSRARGPGVHRTKDAGPVNGSAMLSREKLTLVQWRDKPIHFVTQPLCTLSAGWRTLTIFSSFSISIFIACLLPPGRGKGEKRTTSSIGNFKHEHVSFPLPPQPPAVPAMHKALEC